MPDAATCLKPLETACRKFAMCARRVFIAHRSGQQKRQRRDARMRVHWEHRVAGGPEVEVIQKHERLDPLAQIARAEQPCHGTVDETYCAGEDPSKRRCADLWFAGRRLDAGLRHRKSFKLRMT